MNVIIDGYCFGSMEAQRYWSHPSSTPIDVRKKECKTLACSGQFVGARKIDGAWNMLIRDLDGNYYLRSRIESVNGGWVNKAEWIPHICEALKIPKGTVLLGEIWLPNNEGSRKITSVLNCLKDKCLDRQKKNGYLHYYIFDVLAWDGTNIMNEGIFNRIQYLTKYKDILQTEYTEIAEYKEGQELWDLYGQVIEAGGEGLVIHRKDYPYEPKKRKARATLKMKKELQDTIDAFADGEWKKPTWEYTGKDIEGWQYWNNVKTGEKLPVGMHYTEYINGSPIEPITRLAYLNYAAAISLSVMKDGEPVHLCYISGIDDTIRKEIVQAPEKWVGQVFEISCMEVEKNAQAPSGYTLRHGKIVGKRADKKKEDCLWEQVHE